MKIFFYLFLFLVIILGISFAVLNANMVAVNYYVGEKEIPLSLLLVFALTIGSLLGWLVSVSMYLKVKRENFRLRGRIKVAEKEIGNLRSIPLADKH